MRRVRSIQEKTLTLAEMRSFWVHTGPEEVKHRLHNLPERLVLYQVEVLVKKVNTRQAPPEVFSFQFTNMWVIHLSKGMTRIHDKIPQSRMKPSFSVGEQSNSKLLLTGCQNVIMINTRLNMTVFGDLCACFCTASSSDIQKNRQQPQK